MELLFRTVTTPKLILIKQCGVNLYYYPWLDNFLTLVSFIRTQTAVLKMKMIGYT